jgi:4-amino-4-deoxy-L-arabinose transferase-like glycosyltransferase
VAVAEDISPEAVPAANSFVAAKADPSDGSAGAPAAQDPSAASSPATPLVARAVEHLVIFVLAWVCAAWSLLTPLARAGIWDPYELEVAELARRIAVNLMNAPALSLSGLDNRVPILSELGRGQLPFSSIALGFKLFGLHDWAGRLPLALWGLLGILACYVLVRRLLDRAAAPVAVLMLASCPLYFLQARTMLGDIVTMASLAIACAGLGLAVFDNELRPGSWRWSLAVGVGALGLLCGFGCRGAILGVALPCLGVASSALLVLPMGIRSWRSPRSLLVWLTLACGLLMLSLGVRALFGSADHYSMLVGAQLAPPKRLPTHDAVLHALGHGLLPWSALLPFAMGALLRTPMGSDPNALERETGLRVLSLVMATLAVLAHGLLSPLIDELPFCGVFAFAIAIAVLFRDLERGRPATLATGVGALALLVLLVMDYRQFPEKALSAFVIGDAKVPDSFKDIGKRFLLMGTALAALGAIAGFWERDPNDVSGEPGTGWRAAWQRSVVRLRQLLSLDFWCNRAGFVREDYRVWPAALKELFHGNPLYAFAAVELALLTLFIEQRTPKKPFHVVPQVWLEQVPAPVVTYGWLAFPGVLLLPWLILAFRDLLRAAFRVLPITRASVAVLGFVAFGLALSVGYYPALAAQLSPRDVFESYRRVAKPGDELGIIGSTSGTSAYYTGTNTKMFDGAAQAATWLLESNAPRRYLVIASSDLGKLNSQYRAQVKPPANLPVADSRSSEILLVTNRPDEAKDTNPLASVVLDQKPTLAHPVDAAFEEELDLVGWEVTTTEGAVTEVLSPGTAYRFRICYFVREKVTGNWQTFIHLDGTERINLDHDTAKASYAMSLWNKGDFIIDEHEFTVARGQAAGKYSVNFGLFQGSRRKKVTRGTQSDNRLSVGEIEIR